MVSDLGTETEIEASAGDKKLRIRGNDLINLLQLIVLCILAYGFYAHEATSAERNSGVVQAVKEQTKVQQEQLNAQREANCLARLGSEQKKQPKEVQYCESLGKGR